MALPGSIDGRARAKQNASPSVDAATEPRAVVALPDPQLAVVAREPQTGPLYVRPLVERCIRAMRQRTFCYDIDVQIEGISPAATLLADARKLEGVFNCIFFTALHLAGANRSKVSIRHLRPSHTLEIEVPGADENDIFWPLRHANGRDARMSSGDGLSTGALAQLLCDLNASLVATRSSGHSTTFRLVMRQPAHR